MDAIKISNMTKSYGKARGVIDLNLTVKEGEFFGFIGPNGAGKSTTIRTLLGLISPTSGQAQILGMDISKEKNKILADVGYLPSEAMFYHGMKVKDILKLSADLRKKDCCEEAKKLCERVQLDVNRKIEELSFGNRKKVAIVCALQHTPKILILDEPTSGLDPNQIEEVRSLIKEIGKTRTVIISTHILQEVENICDRVIIISDGKIVADSPTGELQEKFGQKIAVNLILEGCTFTEAKKIFSSIEEIQSITKRTDDFSAPSKKAVGLCIHVNGTAEIRDKIFKLIVKNKLIPYEITTVKNSLEDIFHILTQKNSSQEN